MYFTITDAIKFASDAMTSFTLYVLIFKFGTTFTKNRLNLSVCFSSELITADFSIKNLVSEVLTLFLKSGFTVF